MMTKLTAKEIAQRQIASRTHGIDAFERRGESALDDTSGKRLDTLRLMAQTREGVVEMLKERTARAMLVAEMAEDWVQKELESGKKFDEIGLLKRLGTYQETARRALMALYTALPDYSKAMDITDFMRGVTDNDNQV